MADETMHLVADNMIAIVTTSDGMAVTRAWEIPADHAPYLSQDLMERYGEPVGETMVSVAATEQAAAVLAEHGAVAVHPGECTCGEGEEAH